MLPIHGRAGCMVRIPVAAYIFESFPIGGRLWAHMRILRLYGDTPLGWAVTAIAVANVYFTFFLKNRSNLDENRKNGEAKKTAQNLRHLATN